MVITMADHLFKMCCKAIMTGNKQKITFRIGNDGVFLTITVGMEVYELYTDENLYRNTLINYRECKAALEEILLKKPQT
jgi:hypothetical protein